MCRLRAGSSADPAPIGTTIIARSVPGSGSTFARAFGAAREPVEAGRGIDVGQTFVSALSNQAPMQGHDRTIELVLVEDCTDDRLLVTDILGTWEKPDFAFTCAATITEARHLIREDPPDAILLDLSLPDATGLEGLRALLASAEGVPIVVLTGLQDEQIGVAALSEGAQDYLVKDEIEPRRLVRAIRHAIERGRVLAAVKTREERYALAVRGANEVLWDWDLDSDVVYFSQRWRGLLGGEEVELRASSLEWFSRVHPDDYGPLKAHMEAHVGGETDQLHHEHRVRTESGIYVWFLVRGLATRCDDGRAYRVVGSLTDITYRKEAEERLRHRALHDELTDLPNRALFSDLLQRAIARSARHPEHLFAVLFLDLDRFKIINDSLGHSVGDKLLVQIARRLEICLRPEDTVARLGGDEFTVLVDGIHGPADAIRVSDRIQKELSRPFDLDGRETFTSASIGIALGSTGYVSSGDLLRDADIAMYRAKSRGKARSELFDRGMHDQAMNLLQLETDLRRAIERDELCVHYQPIVDFGTRGILGFEALLRWFHSERGLLPPSAFIPLAEETGLIVPIGRWILAEACRRCRIWTRRFPEHESLGVSVNLSGRQLAEPGLAADVERILRETGLEPCRLRLEMTESVVMKNAQLTVDTLTQLRRLGVRLHIDDFGTGYSSLSYLHRFPVDTLKIDRSFVSSLDQQKENLEIIKSIVGIARNLRMSVTAEGVETERQLELLVGSRCRQGQGFLFARPEAAERAEALLVQSPSAV